MKRLTAEETQTPTETPAETETPAPTEAPAADETPAPATTIQESGDADSTVTTTHIATKVGEVPAVLADVDGVTADTFKTAFETVKVQKGDVTYTVEVIPADTVYFIDSVAASGSNGAHGQRAVYRSLRRRQGSAGRPAAQWQVRPVLPGRCDLGPGGYRRPDQGL